MNIRRASCCCGQLVVTCKGDPVRVSMCHCFACQKRTGSVFGAQARFKTEEVTVEGRSTDYLRIGDEGNRVHFHFCPDCGSTVYYRFESAPEFTAVTVGAFADPKFPAPVFSVYEDRKHAWVVVPEGAEHMA
ncbi:GFA family protein [Polyangium sp. y55x31]|uniref:GFA family protein n=1 Tax=Polyangium sp. y55x31 TaxID=3042688 RepID=UPI002482E569|nr:GFA family protein [Polyangium sp. y55x31]MDI1484340.1 GFA family protein [Polyangium sp. y55x31]